MGYKHKVLNDEERQKFIALFRHNIKNNALMTHIILNKLYALIFFVIIVSLLIISITTSKSVMGFLGGLILGIIAIQINFVFSHLWAHALMLEYSLWDVEQMPKKLGQIPAVMFYAFYHHHHTKQDDWMKEELSYNTDCGAFMVAVAHWESFSLITSFYPINHILSKLFVFGNLILFPTQTTSFFLGYELGAILLPISHAWVHDKRVSKYLYYPLKLLEVIGIFATKQDHVRHHIYSTPTVYQGFTSSGIYSPIFDKFIDKIWDNTFYWCEKTNRKMYNVLWYVMTIVMYSSVVLSCLLLVGLNI